MDPENFNHFIKEIMDKASNVGGEEVPVSKNRNNRFFVTTKQPIIKFERDRKIEFLSSPWEGDVGPLN